MNYIPLSKKTKKEQRAFYNSQRVKNPFNTGVRTMKTEKHLSRNQQKALDKKMIQEYN